MTIAATDAELPFVRVIFNMTTPAVTRKGVLYVACMARIALQGLVCAEQRKTAG